MIPEKLPVDLREAIKNKSIDFKQLDERLTALKNNSDLKPADIQKGDLLIVKCDTHSSRTLFTTPIAKSNLRDYFNMTNNRAVFRLDTI
jgi:hypothetical protein